MTMATQQTAETNYIIANGIKLAYRQLGPTTGLPLVMLMHFRGNMDFWDPALINALAKSRPVLLMDNAGIGKSEGEIPTTLRGWAAHVLALLEALNIRKIDLLGFSMGGACAQHVAMMGDQLVRRLIIAGSRTSQNSKTIIGPRDIFYPLAESVTEHDFKAAWTDSFFNHNSRGKTAAQESWDRIFSREIDRSHHLSPELAKRQVEAFGKFSAPHPLNPYERIREIDMPVFVANGDNDLLIPTENSVELARILPNAHLHIYPDSGHGFLFQHAELFASHVALFLGGIDSRSGIRGEKL
jgi:pimeloyl-ACP methyl ester carboxylesterase